MTRYRSAGFTLLELAVIIATLTVLAYVIIPRAAENIRKSNEGVTKGNLGNLRSVLSIYYGDNEGQFPKDALGSLTVGGKYIRRLPKSYQPYYHSANTLVDTPSIMSEPSMLSLDNGHWRYWNSSFPHLYRSIGDLWLGCSHTDTKSSVWTTY